MFSIMLSALNTSMSSYDVTYFSITQQRRLPLLLAIMVIIRSARLVASEALTSSSASNFSPSFDNIHSNQNNGFETTKNGYSDFREQNNTNGEHLNGKQNGVHEDESSQFEDHPVSVDYIAETKLPTEFGQFQLRAYRIRHVNGERNDNNFIGNEPVVIYNPDKPPFGENSELAKNVPVRIHDQCITSEVFGSKRCDCKEQLLLALEYVRVNGGAIIYMQQEGRGIGLANKIAAYQLQDMGMDTVDANLHLGFPEDCRQYGAVPSMLEDMNIESIQLLTNNPRKVERMTTLGVDVTATIPVVVPEANPYNQKYLKTKQERMRHTNLESLLSSPTFISKVNGQKQKNGIMQPRKMFIQKKENSPSG